MMRSLRVVTVWAITGLALGCSGQIPSSPLEAEAGRAPAGAPPRSGGEASPPACRVEPPTGARLRRLTNREYESVVRDLLGKRPTGLVSAFPPDAVIDGFDNNVETLTISAVHAERYREAAERVAAELVQAARGTPATWGCDPATNRSGCARKVAGDLGRRILRRPLTADETAALVATAETAASDADPWAGIALVVEALLQAPSFLYRTELGTADPGRPGVFALNGFETAARLSFLLWGSTPDAALLDDAAAGRLVAAGGVVAAATRMLADDRAKETMRTFSSQWLRLGVLATTELSPVVHPAWSEGLRASMGEETRQFVGEVLASGDLRGLLDAPFSFLDARLAKHYGVKGPAAGSAFARVSFTDEPRGGLLTQGSVLTANGREEGLAPILRGKYVRDVLLCSPPPDAPADVPPLPPLQAGQSVRQQLEAHRTNPTCAGCHRLLDAVGFGLENYDLLGRYRAADANGRPLSGDGRVEGLVEPRFVGARELAARLRASSEFSVCVSKQLFRFTFGRAETEGDACFIRQLEAALTRGGHSLRDLLLAMVRDDSFRHVREEDMQ